MGCLEPNKNISEEAKKIIGLLGGSKMSREEIARAAGFAPPLVARKLRELAEKELIVEAGGYMLSEKGKEALSMLNKEAESD